VNKKFVNPLPPVGRENNMSLYGVLSCISIFVIIAGVVVSAIWVRPTSGNAFLVMILWFAALGVAIIVSLISWIKYSAKTVLITMTAAIVITALGTIAAFLSGDKFDAIRAAIIAVVLVIMNYPRRKYLGRAA
jgi:hypothetical protein